MRNKSLQWLPCAWASHARDDEPVQASSVPVGLALRVFRSRASHHALNFVFAPFTMTSENVEAPGKRWGPETEAGLRVLAAIAAEQAQVPTTGSAEPQSSAANDGRKRKRRWGEESAGQAVPVDGLPGVRLPEAVAAVAAAIDVSCVALQHELIRVRRTFRIRLPRASGTRACVLLDRIPFVETETLRTRLPRAFDAQLTATDRPSALRVYTHGT